MRVSPKFLAILATSGLMGLSASQAQADPGLELESSATSTPGLLQGADPQPPAGAALLMLSPGDTGSPVNDIGVSATPTPDLATESSQALRELPPPATAVPSEDMAGLRTLINGYRSAVIVDPASLLPQPDPAQIELSPSLRPSQAQAPDTPLEPDPAIPLEPDPAASPEPDPAASPDPDPAAPEAPSAPTVPADAETSPGGADLTREEAQDILDRAVERNSQRNQTAPPEETPAEEGTPAEGEAGPETEETAPPEAEAEPRVLVAEVIVQSDQGDIDTELVDLVYSVIETRAGRTTTRTQLQQDINNIFATGFFADVDARPTDTDLGVQVTFVVAPNPVLTDVQVTGNEVLPQTVVDEIFADQKGEIINLLEFQDGILELNQWYQDNGYVLAQVVAAPQVSPDGLVTLEVAEGVIESIQVRFRNEEGESVDDEGNPIDGRTQDYIITREFETMPGDVFNQARIEQDFQRVFGLQIFEDVVPGLEPGTEDPRQVNLIVNVTERSTGSVAAGLGFNFTGDLFGTVSYRQDNFGGNNQKFTAEAQLSTRDILFDLSFTDPWIAGDPFRTSYTATAFARRTINLNFDGGPSPINLPDPDNTDPNNFSSGDRARIRRLGGGITFSRPLDNGWTVAVGTLVQNVSARDFDGGIAPVDAKGNPLTISPTGVDDLWTFPISATLDRRNDPFNPTSGGILRLNTEQSIPLGRGSIFMNRLRGSYSHYIPISLINFSDGPQALAFNIQLGTIVGDAPPYEAFALGGTNSIRGYDEGEVGSGRSYAQFTAEYRFPLFSFLGGALFLDVGSDLGSGNAVPGAPGPARGKPGSGYGYGAGVRIQTPLGPLRIDYGLNDSGEGRIHFGIGERF
ncbi:MAG: BamA/TamA family outer membrane protein [Nodosilinea sp.]